MNHLHHPTGPATTVRDLTQTQLHSLADIVFTVCKRCGVLHPLSAACPHRTLSRRGLFALGLILGLGLGVGLSLWLG